MTLFKERVGSFGISTGSFDGPVDVVVDRDGYFYVLDAGNSRIQKFDKSMNFVLSFGSYGSGPGQFINPRALALSPGGLLYAVDTGNNRIQQFTREGVLIKTWGSLGSGINNFKRPNDLTFKDDTSFWVLDAGNDRVLLYRFDIGRELRDRPAPVREFGSSFADRGAVFKGLVSIAWSTDRFGYLYILGENCLVQQFQEDGRLENSWPALAPEAGLCVPARIEIDESGTNDYVYVLDAGNSQLVRFNLAGRFLAVLRGAVQPFSKPLGLAVNPEREEIFVADTKNNIVQKFTLR